MTITAERTTTDEPSTGRVLAIALAVGVAWTAVLLGAWALQPLSDSMVVGFVERDDGSFDAVVEETECNTLFDSEPLDASQPLPDFEFGFDFPRPPCEKPHRDARIIFVMNAVFMMVLLVAWVIAFRRWRQSTTDTR